MCPYMWYTDAPLYGLWNWGQNSKFLVDWTSTSSKTLTKSWTDGWTEEWMKGCTHRRKNNAPSMAIKTWSFFKWINIANEWNSSWFGEIVVVPV